MYYLYSVHDVFLYQYKKSPVVHVSIVTACLLPRPASSSVPSEASPANWMAYPILSGLWCYTTVKADASCCWQRLFRQTLCKNLVAVTLQSLIVIYMTCLAVLSTCLLCCRHESPNQSACVKPQQKFLSSHCTGQCMAPLKQHCRRCKSQVVKARQSRDSWGPTSSGS